MENPLLFSNCPECGRPGFEHMPEDDCYRCKNAECGCVMNEQELKRVKISEGDSIFTKILKALRLKR